MFEFDITIISKIFEINIFGHWVYFPKKFNQRVDSSHIYLQDI